MIWYCELLAQNVSKRAAILVFHKRKYKKMSSDTIAYWQ